MADGQMVQLSGGQVEVAVVQQQPQAEHMGSSTAGAVPAPAPGSGPPAVDEALQ
jgi:hypothetical protein